MHLSRGLDICIENSEVTNFPFNYFIIIIKETQTFSVTYIYR